MWVESALLAWTGIAFLWWIVSLWVITRRPRAPRSQPSPSTAGFLTIFKPLPRMDDAANLDKTAGALRSFVAQLDTESEILIGIHPDERDKWQGHLEAWSRDFPAASLRVIVPENDRDTKSLSNRKVAWQRLLAPHAKGDLWLWSDADITAPLNYLREAREEYQGSGAGLLTHSYVVRRVQSAPDLLNALFVNVEIYPGARLVGRKDEICFGLGAGLLFSRKDFEAKINWEEIGSFLADDFFLGNHLPPARLGSTILETFSGSSNLKQSALHYLRWQKTIRWCNPLGFASQIVVLPMTGWLATLVLFPFSPTVWLGAMGTALMEILWVALLFRFTDCRPPLRFYGLIPVWSVFRVLAFWACWLPWPVIWRSQAWWGPIRRSHSA